MASTTSQRREPRADSKEGWPEDDKEKKRPPPVVTAADASSKMAPDDISSPKFVQTLKANVRETATFDSLSKVIMAISVYVGLLWVFKLHYFLPYDAGFALVVLWCCSVAAGKLMDLVGMPPLLGMLCAGILLKNIGDPVRGLPASWAAAIRAFGLMNILMRGGLEMDMAAVQRVGLAVARLTVMPGVSEAFCAALLGIFIFEMPFFLALSMGFILAAVSPAVVVGGMFNLQARGYGVRQGIPSLVVAAASFDDVVAISGFSIVIGLATGAGNPIVDALHGPINIIGGLLFGLAGAWVLSLTRIWNEGWKRSFMMLSIGVSFTFASKYAHFSGAGALACLIMAAAANKFWTTGVGGRLSMGPDPHAAHMVELDLRKVWQLVSEPLLFSCIGAELDFNRIEPGTIPKAVGLICGGCLIRCVVAFFSTFGAGLSTKERLFIALAWIPKATVQAALGPVPLDMMKNALVRSDDPEKYDKHMQFGVDILTTAVFSILITAPAGLLVIQYLGPAWLEKEDPMPKFNDLDASPDKSDSNVRDFEYDKASKVSPHAKVYPHDPGIVNGHDQVNTIRTVQEDPVLKISSNPSDDQAHSEPTVTTIAGLRAASSPAKNLT